MGDIVDAMRSVCQHSWKEIENGHFQTEETDQNSQASYKIRIFYLYELPKSLSPPENIFFFFFWKKQILAYVFMFDQVESLLLEQSPVEKSITSKIKWWATVHQVDSL